MITKNIDSFYLDSTEFDIKSVGGEDANNGPRFGFTEIRDSPNGRQQRPKPSDSGISNPLLVRTNWFSEMTAHLPRQRRR